ncbi:hypothetical protein COL154_007397 [Colletotrichum chrysophilum]|uniref:Uncharacterized protein n=1 Tax=Colletotrichum chrysophilum TaxID=1836956 RepID=A0AAD9A5E9_9PEZI|nr:hypothetical protein KNSL1_009058 [Colletotrichum chrysophilum]KAJ0360648.1 hypothetical protein COL154_007397 [Colletotrichum chrysophilum]KAK1841806.1 hypothetical protein CCHR01_15559 [Colletotrichum chrysophilum]
MPTISPSPPTPLIQKSRLISSIAELEETVKETQAAADLIETEIAYKDAEIDGLKRDRISHSGSTKRFDDAITQIRVKIQQLCDKFDETIDTLAALRDRLEKKKAKLAAIAPVESTDAPDPKDDEEAAALLEITSTPWEQVFVTSDDGKTFVRPAMLRGVPSTPITEDGPYWVPTWTKFVDAMDADRLQRQYEDDIDERHERMLHGPLTDEEKEDFDKRDRRYYRLANELRVVKRWFCPGKTMHPNQMMAKEHMPAEGICQSHNLYQICNVLNRLQALHVRGELAMEPLYFLLWRMSVIFERGPHTGAKSFCRSIVEEGHHSLDPVMRQAIIRGAQHTNDYNFYGRKLDRIGGQPLSRTSHVLLSTSTGEQHGAGTTSEPSTATPSGLRGPRLTSASETYAPQTPDTPSPRSRRTPTKKRVQTTAPEQGRRKRRKSSTTIRQRTPEDEVIVVDDFTPPKKMRRLEFIIPLRPRSSVETLDFTENPAVASSSTRAAVSTTAKTSSTSEASERTSHRQGQTRTDLVRMSRPTDVEKHIGAAQDVIMEAMTEGEEMQNQWLHIGTSGSQHMSLDNLNSDGHPRDLAEGEHHTGNQEPDMSSDSREDEDMSSSGVTEEEEGLLPRDEEVQFLAEHPRMDVGPSPFPRTGKKVSHGFIFPWLPCTEREAMVTYY